VRSGSFLPEAKFRRLQWRKTPEITPRIDSWKGDFDAAHVKKEEA